MQPHSKTASGRSTTGRSVVRLRRPTRRLASDSTAHCYRSYSPIPRTKYLIKVLDTLSNQFGLAWHWQGVKNVLVRLQRSEAFLVLGTILFFYLFRRHPLLHLDLFYAHTHDFHAASIHLNTLILPLSYMHATACPSIHRHL